MIPDEPTFHQRLLAAPDDLYLVAFVLRGSQESLAKRAFDRKRRNRVKKNQSTKKDQDQDRRPRRLTLSRETIQILSDPALFGVAGGAPISKGTGTTTDPGECPYY